MKRILCTLLALLCITTISTACDSDIVLTDQNQKIADTIYANINRWEQKSTGATCRYCYIQRVNGTLYFECVYTDNKASSKYKISGGKFIEENYLPSGNGFVAGSILTMSMPNYNINATPEEKREYVENLVKEMQDPQKWREFQDKHR